MNEFEFPFALLGLVPGLNIADASLSGLIAICLVPALAKAGSMFADRF